LKGFLLLVVEKDAAVAAGLSFIQDDRLIFGRLGVLDGDNAHVKKGAQSAVYYFTIQYAKEQGLRGVDLTTSHPLFQRRRLSSQERMGCDGLSGRRVRTPGLFLQPGTAGRGGPLL